MKGNETITHQGLVTNTQNGHATIHLIQEAECHSCRMKEFCGVTDEDRNTFYITDQSLKVGDSVQVAIKPSTGFMAMFWAYFFPFLLIVGILIIGNILLWKEWKSGVIALASLVPYYLILVMIRHFFHKTLQLDITKI